MNSLFLIHLLYATYIAFLTYLILRNQQSVSTFEHKIYQHRKSIASSMLVYDQQCIVNEQELKTCKQKLKKLEDDAEVTRHRLDLYEEQIRKLQEPRACRVMKKAPKKKTLKPQEIVLS